MAQTFVRIGSLLTDTPSVVIPLWASCNASGNFDTFKQTESTLPYQVTAGKTLYLAKIFYSGGAAGTIDIGYGDTSVSNSATPPTNLLLLQGFITLAASTNYTYDIIAKIPATKFPCVSVAGAGTERVMLWGFEL